MLFDLSLIVLSGFAPFDTSSVEAIRVPSKALYLAAALLWIAQHSLRVATVGRTSACMSPTIEASVSAVHQRYGF